MAFQALGNPQECRDPPPRELLKFPEDLPHLHQILEDYYHLERWICEEEDLWPAPYYAWRALGLSPDPSSVPVLLDCLELCDAGENVDEYLEFVPLLAAHGEALLAHAEQKFREEYLWNHDAYPAGVVLDSLGLWAETNPTALPRILSMVRARLKQYRSNSPLLNAILIADLAKHGDRESLPLARKIFTEDFCDTDYFPWNELIAKFPELPPSPPQAEIPLAAFDSEPYMGDEAFTKALHAAGIQGNLLDKKGFLLGMILHPGAPAPSIAMEEFFFDAFTEESAAWETEGQQVFMIQQFSQLWNQLADFQNRLFPLEELLNRESVAKTSLAFSRATSWFVDEFFHGLTLGAQNKEKGLLLRHPFLQELAEKEGQLARRIEENNPAERERNAVFSCWNQGFLSFAQDMQALRLGMLNELEKRQTVGRNDPCPCGSGKKFKKCCLQ